MTDTDNLPMHKSLVPDIQGEVSPSLPTPTGGTNQVLVQGSWTEDSLCAWIDYQGAMDDIMANSYTFEEICKKYPFLDTTKEENWARVWFKKVKSELKEGRILMEFERLP